MGVPLSTSRCCACSRFTACTTGTTYTNTLEKVSGQQDSQPTGYPTLQGVEACRVCIYLSPCLSHAMIVTMPVCLSVCKPR
jgi:hypothetical protein